jgi:phosphotransferase system  glucose/maltose/N-acetylglucosamine-specific IIC component
VSNDVQQPIAVVDGDETIIYGYDEKFILPTKLYDELKQGAPVAPEGEVIRPISVIDFLTTGDNPVTMKAMVAREVEIQRQDDKTRQNLILFILAGAGIAILCAALAYIMITKSADVASVAVQSAVSTGTGVSIK